MQIIPIKTRVMNPPKDDLYDVLNNFCPSLKEGDVLLITSKILAIHQGLCIPMSSVKNKDDLIKKEAEIFIPREECPGEYAILTLKESTLIPSAGVDESNANDYYVLWPENSEKEAENICKYLKKKFSLKKLAVIITDSHILPMRRGVLGISIGAYGLELLKDYREEKDIFGRTIEMTQVNIVDALATMGVLLMGEGAEQKPMAIIRDANFVKFTDQEKYKELLIPVKEDIYYPLLKNFYKRK